MRKIKNIIIKAKTIVSKYYKTIRKVVICLIACGLLALITVWIVNLMSKKEDTITLEDTLNIIEKVKPRGEIYVCSSLIEDYAIKREMESQWIMADKEHVCVQTMTQKCSYMIDLDKVEYESNDTTKIVRVKLPAPEYVASTQSTSFISDDSNYWAKNMTSTNAMKQQVENQIRQSFDTEENRRKAERYAEDAVSEILRKLGFEVEFVRTIRQQRD